jgi:hypothetical protein
MNSPPIPMISFGKYVIRKKITSNRSTVENFRIHINSGMLILNSVMFNLLKVKKPNSNNFANN